MEQQQRETEDQPTALVATPGQQTIAIVMWFGVNLAQVVFWSFFLGVGVKVFRATSGL